MEDEFSDVMLEEKLGEELSESEGSIMVAKWKVVSLVVKRLR